MSTRPVGLKGSISLIGGAFRELWSRVVGSFSELEIVIFESSSDNEFRLLLVTVQEKEVIGWSKSSIGVDKARE